jgi:hypothetical protein
LIASNDKFHHELLHDPDYMARPRPTAATKAAPAALWKTPVTAAAESGEVVEGVAEGSSSRGGLEEESGVWDGGAWEVGGVGVRGGGLEPVKDGGPMGVGIDTGMSDVGRIGGEESVMIVIWITEVSSEAMGGSTGRLNWPVPLDAVSLAIRTAT